MNKSLNSTFGVFWLDCCESVILPLVFLNNVLLQKGISYSMSTLAYNKTAEAHQCSSYG